MPINSPFKLHAKMGSWKSDSDRSAFRAVFMNSAGVRDTPLMDTGLQNWQRLNFAHNYYNALEGTFYFQYLRLYGTYSDTSKNRIEFYGECKRSSGSYCSAYGVPDITFNYDLPKKTDTILVK